MGWEMQAQEAPPDRCLYKGGGLLLLDLALYGFLDGDSIVGEDAGEGVRLEGIYAFYAPPT